MPGFLPKKVIAEPGFSRKLTLAFLAVILTVALTIPVAFYAFNEIRQSSSKARDAAQTLEKVSEFQRAIGNMRSAARDYVESGSVKDRNVLVDNLNTLTDGTRCISDSSKCRSDDASYELLPEGERSQWLLLIDEASTATSMLKGEVAAGRGRAAITAFDRRMRDDVETPARMLTDKVRSRGREAQDEIDSSIGRSAVLLVMVLIAALVLATVLAWLLPRSVMRRLDKLRIAAHQLAGGDLTVRVEERKVGDDEIAELITDFNMMAKALQQREEENRMLQHQLHHSLLNEQERATRDPLTSLRNHRYFQESLRAEIDRCQRAGRRVTIAIIDLDNFKQVNDRFGHHEGDAVLLRVTKGISDNLRPYDLACRLGGEEFGVIFPETDAQEAKAVLDRIATHVVNFGPNGGRATFSAGLTTFPEHAATQAELYQRADEAAYTAKANGKAQSVIYDPSQVTAMDSEERLRQRSREAVLTTATTLVSAVDQKDPYTRNHSELTAIYAATLARAMGLDEEQVKLVYRAGLLHDVGKIGIADTILRKPGRLTVDEYEQVKMHPEFSYRILETAEMEPIATWVRHHHEHWNGSGYPFGLSGDDIPLGSRIVLVADAFEAMTSDRVYRRALSIRQAVDELVGNAGTQFDPHVVGLMVELVASGVFDQVRAQYGKPADLSMQQPAAAIAPAPEDADDGTPVAPASPTLGPGPHEQQAPDHAGGSAWPPGAPTWPTAPDADDDSPQGDQHAA